MAVDHDGIECRLSELEGVNLWTYEQKSLSQALNGAAFVVTISAIAAVEVSRCEQACTLEWLLVNSLETKCECIIDACLRRPYLRAFQ